MLGATVSRQDPHWGRCCRVKSEDQLGPHGRVSGHGDLVRITAFAHFHLPLLANSFSLLVDPSLGKFDKTRAIIYS